MATTGSRLMTRETSYISGKMTEHNHLGAALLAKPHVFKGHMDTLFSASNYYSNNPLTSMLQGIKHSKHEITTTEYEWELKAGRTRPGVAMENLNGVNTTPGKFKRPFKLKLDVNYYVPGDEIHPGTSGKKYVCRVVNMPERNGTGFVYDLRLMSDNDADFVPVKFLENGQQWGKLFSQYEEAAQQSGSTMFSTPIAFRNTLSKYRKTYSVTDLANQEVLECAIPDNQGKLHKFWVKYAEAQLWQEWYQELERGAWYSRSANSVLGDNGRKVLTSAGLQEQLEDSHIHRYNVLTTRLIEEYLMDIFYGRVKPGKGRQLVGFTGEYGMIQFHRAVQSWQEKSGFIKNIEVYTNKIQSPLHNNALEGGYQYVKFNMANGSGLTLIHNPLYDDRDIHFEIDPLTGYPVESQRITFLDFTGEGANDSNIMLIDKKDSFKFAYIEGLESPFGVKKGGTAAHAGEYYSMHVSKMFGINIKDVTKCGELILNV